MGPIDYTSGQTATTDFLRSLQGGLQTGAAIQQVQQQQAAAQAAQAQAAQYQADAQAAMANPTPQAFSALALKYPSQREAVKQSWDGLSAADQKAEGDTMSQAYSALLAGKPEIAKQVVQSQIDARKNSGLDTSHFDNALTLLDTDPTKAQAALGFTLSHIGDPKDFAAKFGALQGEQRTADLAPAALRTANAKAAGDETDNVLKNQGVVGQVLGSLQGKGAKPAQAYTAIKSLQSRGVLSPEAAADLQASVPTDPKALDDWFGQQRDAGIGSKDQKAFVTPDANTVATNDRIAAEGAANRANQVKVTQMVSDREAANSGGDTSDFTKAAIDNAAARYNLDGSLPPMGMGKAASAGRTTILNRAAELKAGVDPEQQRRDQLNNKAGIANQNKVIQAFNTGKEGKAVRSFNVLLSHLDTLDSLSDALGNGNVQLINRLGNAYAKATGNAAPTNFDAVKHIVGDEVVKAVTGGAGALGDRESIAKAIDGANSPAQLKGVIKNFKDLSVGQLNGLEQQYRAGSQRDDFEHYLDAPARLMRTQHGGARPASAGPAVGAVEASADGKRYRFKGGDAASPSSWEPVR